MLVVFSSSSVVCNVHGCEVAVVGQSQRKSRFGNLGVEGEDLGWMDVGATHSSTCSWCVWHAIEQAEQMPRCSGQVRQR
jgi:hypothetical protein